MQLLSARITSMLFILLISLYPVAVNATTLTVNPDSHWALHAGAALLLYAHIGGGVVGIVAGFWASLSAKGGLAHKLAGRVFVVSMFVCYLVGALVAPFLQSQQSTNFVAGILALYLLVTGALAARRKQFVAGWQEKAGLAIALLITAIGASFMVLARQSPDGSFDGSPPQAYVLFVLAGSLAAIGEFYVIQRTTLSPRARITRHLWRVCMSFFIASASLVFGQAQVFPAWFNASIFPLMLGFFPLIILMIYVIKMSFPPRLFKRIRGTA